MMRGGCRGRARTPEAPPRAPKLARPQAARPTLLFVCLRSRCAVTPPLFFALSRLEEPPPCLETATPVPSPHQPHLLFCFCFVFLAASQPLFIRWATPSVHI